MSILVLGLSGSGKSSVCDLLSNALSFSVINLGRIILAAPGCTPIPIQRKLTEREVAEQYDLSQLLIDAHAIFYNELGEIEYGFDSDDLKILHVEMILLIETSPEVIIKRRKNDQTIRPDRRVESVSDINHMKKKQQRFVEALVTENKIPLYVIDNSTDKLEHILNHVVNIIKQSAASKGGDIN